MPSSAAAASHSDSSDAPPFYCAMSFSDLPDHVVAMIADACPDGSRVDLAMASWPLAAHVARTTAARPIGVALLDTPGKLRWASSVADWGDGATALKLARAIVLSGDASVLAHAWRASGRRLDLEGICLLAAWTGSVDCLRWACGKLDFGFSRDPIEFVCRAFDRARVRAALTGRLDSLECLVALFGDEWATPRGRGGRRLAYGPTDTYASIRRLLGY